MNNPRWSGVRAPNHEFVSPLLDDGGSATMVRDERHIDAQKAQT